MGIGCVILIPLALIGLSLSPMFRLRTIIVDRADPRVSEKTVIASLAPLFSQRLFFLSTRDVAEPLEKDIVDFEHIEVQKQYPNTLHVTLTLEPIVAQIIIAEPDNALVSTGSVLKQYLTKSGKVVEYEPFKIGSGIVLPVITLMDWGVRPEPGSVPLEATMIQAIEKAVRALADQFGQIVTERVAYVRAQEFHLKLKEFTLFFDVRSSLEEHLGRYRLFLQAAGKEAAKSYVDLRLNDRVIYR